MRSEGKAVDVGQRAVGPCSVQVIWTSILFTAGSRRIAGRGRHSAPDPKSFALPSPSSGGQRPGGILSLPSASGGWGCGSRVAARCHQDMTRSRGLVLNQTHFPGDAMVVSYEAGVRACLTR